MSENVDMVDFGNVPRYLKNRSFKSENIIILRQYCDF